MTTDQIICYLREQKDKTFADYIQAKEADSEVEAYIAFGAHSQAGEMLEAIEAMLEEEGGNDGNRG